MCFFMYIFYVSFLNMGLASKYSILQQRGLMESSREIGLPTDIFLQIIEKPSF